MDRLDQLETAVRALVQRVDALEKSNHDQLDLYRRIQIDDEGQLNWLYDELKKLREIINHLQANSPDS